MEHLGDELPQPPKLAHQAKGALEMVRTEMLATGQRSHRLEAGMPLQATTVHALHDRASKEA